MRIGLSALFCLGKPLRSALRIMGQFDVEHIEVVDEGIHELNSKRVEAIRKFTKGRDLSISVHAPFADINIASTSPSLNSAIMRRLKRSIRLSARLNPEYWIFHPGIKSAISDLIPGLDWKINLDSVRCLLREAKHYGIKIAIENTPRTFPFLLRGIKDFKRFYEELGDEGMDLGMALDVGHANIDGQLDEMIRFFRGRIVHIHLHDNNGDRDSHLGIGFGKINWLRLISDLRDIGYNGVLVIESISNVKESISLLRELVSERSNMTTGYVSPPSP